MRWLNLLQLQHGRCFLILWNTPMASTIRTSWSCWTGSDWGAACFTLTSSTACIRLALSVGMYSVPSTLQRDWGTIDISYWPIVSSSFGTKLGLLPWLIKNFPSNSRYSCNLMTLSPNSYLCFLHPVGKRLQLKLLHCVPNWESGCGDQTFWNELLEALLTLLGKVQDILFCWSDTRTDDIRLFRGVFSLNGLSPQYNSIELGQLGVHPELWVKVLTLSRGQFTSESQNVPY